MTETNNIFAERLKTARNHQGAKVRQITEIQANDSFLLYIIHIKGRPKRNRLLPAAFPYVNILPGHLSRPCSSPPAVLSAYPVRIQAVRPPHQPPS